MKHLEDDLLMAAAKILDLSGLVWFHPENERACSARQGVRRKKKGVKAGVPDILIFTSIYMSGMYSEHESDYRQAGLAIELKIDKNSLTEYQREWCRDLEDNGWLVGVCYNIEGVISILKEYYPKEMKKIKL